MASLVALSVTCPATRKPTLSSSSCIRSDVFCETVLSRSKTCLSARPQKKVFGTSIKAMGGPKFKGTQMRQKHLTEMIEKKVSEAKAVCEGDQTSDECKVAWDEVEEVSQAKADLRLKMEKQDPLEFYCQDNPETDECRIYDD